MVDGRYENQCRTEFDEKCETKYEEKCETKYETVNEQVDIVAIEQKQPSYDWNETRWWPPLPGVLSPIWHRVQDRPGWKVWDQVSP